MRRRLLLAAFTVVALFAGAALCGLVAVSRPATARPAGEDGREGGRAPRMFGAVRARPKGSATTPATSATPTIPATTSTTPPEDAGPESSAPPRPGSDPGRGSDPGSDSDSDSGSGPDGGARTRSTARSSTGASTAGRGERDESTREARSVAEATAPGKGTAPEDGVAEAEKEPEKPAEEEEKDRLPPGTGLLGDYWKLADTTLTDFPDVAALGAPVVRRVDPRVEFRDEFNLPFLGRNIAVRWRGFLLAPEDGVYTIVLGSDDGAHLAIDGTPAIDLGGLHSFVETAVELPLLEGLHAVEIRFFNNYGPGACIFSWAPPGGALEVVPPDVLYPPAGVPPSEAAPEVPVVLAVLPERARQGEAVTITGTGFGDPALAHRATFGGIDMRLSTVEPGVIVATLPPGVDRAEILVWVEERPGQGLPYEAGDVFGLLAEYVPGPPDVEMRSLADVPPPGSPGAFRRVEPRIAFGGAASFLLPFPARRFGARYQGTLYVPADGPRLFRITSDDGSRLYLDGALAIDNDGLHGMASADGTVDLGAGFHAIALEFFENEGYEGLVLEWQGPGGTVSEIPRANLYAPPDLFFATAAPPAIEAVTPAEGAPGDLVDVTGRGFAGDARDDRVTISGRLAPIVSAGPVRLVVRVPDGARSGPLIVQTGALASKGFDFRVIGRGLAAAYFRFDEPLERCPAVDHLRPDVERIERRILFGEDYSFGLPFETERFAARITGEIEAPVAGEYFFRLMSDDGSRLLIDGRVAIDNDGLHPPHAVEVRLPLEAGRHTLRIDFFENGGFAALALEWAPPGRGVEIVPETALFPE